MHDEPVAVLVKVLIDSIDAASVEAARPALNSVNLIAFG